MRRYVLLSAVGAPLAALLVRSAYQYHKATPVQRYNAWRTIANVRRLSLRTLFNVIRWFLSARARQYFFPGLRPLAVTDVPLPRAISMPPIYMTSLRETSAREANVGAPLSAGMLAAGGYRAPLESVFECRELCDPAVPGIDSPAVRAALRVVGSLVFVARGALVPAALAFGSEAPRGPFVDATVWARAAGLGLLLAWTVPPEWAALVAQLEPGHAPPAGALDEVPELYLALRRAGLVLTASEEQAELVRWETLVAGARRRFAACGVVALDGLLPSAHLRALRRHHRALGDSRHGLSPSCGGASLYRWSEPTAMLLNTELAPFVERVTGERVRPERPVTHWYGPRSGLELHVDSAPFAFSLSIIVDEARGSDTPPWPFTVIGADTEPWTDYRLPFGGAVLFHGGVLPHYRDVTTAQTVTSMSLSFDRLAF